MQKSLHYPTGGRDGHAIDMAQQARMAAADNLKRWREAHGYSVYALARLAGISRNTIDNVELNRNAVTLDKLEALASVFGRQVWELLRPAQPVVHKGVRQTPDPRHKTTEAGLDILHTLSVTSKLGRGAKPLDEAPDDILPTRTNGIGSDRPRPKGGKKVAKVVKARTKP